MSENHSTSPLLRVNQLSIALVWASLYPDVEFWIGVPGFLGYEVSSKARVRSFKYRRGAGGRGGWKCVIMETPQTYLYPTTHKKSGKHLMITLHQSRKRTIQQVGYWMLSAFVGPCPPNHDCCHNDGDASNNDLNNLRWGTRSDNAIDTVKHGKCTFNTKLNPERVRAIRSRLAAGDAQKKVSEDFGIAASTVSFINSKRIWGWVI